MPIASVINNICKLFLKPGYDYFFRNIHRVAEVQENILLQTIRKNSRTQFGRDNGFESITSITAYQDRISIRDYSSFDPYIKEIMSGKENVLTTEKVKLLEPTGGSESGSKLIPYTKQLQDEFNAAINCWLYDLFLSYPAAAKGKSYWSISPIEKTDQIESKVTIGFEDDSAYLGIIGSIIKKTLVMPSAVKKVRSMENFRYLTALFMLKEPDISLISIWNPTFLLILIDYMKEHMRTLIKDIYDGTISLPEQEDISYLKNDFSKSKKRAQEIEKIYSAGFNGNFSRFWKKLTILSCWGDGPSELYAPKLTGFFPDVTFQYKGLLATEGIISFPLVKTGGNAAAYTSHFLEFQPVSDRAARPKLIHELEVGESYTVLLTTGGGLYRYCLQDVVEVTGKQYSLPLLTFTGRDKTSDLFGEKLAEGHIKKIMTESFKKLQIKPDFYMASCELLETGGYYMVFFETKENISKGKIEELAREAELRLQENYHYKYARSLGQLHHLKVRQIINGAGTYLDRCLAEGRKAGDIKPVILDKKNGWNSFFKSR